MTLNEREKSQDYRMEIRKPSMTFSQPADRDADLIVRANNYKGEDAAE